MKKISIILCSAILLFGCKNETEESTIDTKEIQVETTDSLPEGEWNGEYMKVEDKDEPKVVRKSRGSDYYSMGKIDITIGDKQLVIDLFERKKNGLTFNTEQINAFITSAFNDKIELKFKKQEIITKAKGKYTASASAKNSFSMVIVTGKNNGLSEYKIENGTAEIINFSPRLGTLEVVIKGTFIDKNGKSEQGEGNIKMNFENPVMTA